MHYCEGKSTIGTNQSGGTGAKIVIFKKNSSMVKEKGTMNKGEKKCTALTTA
jgi:hypothetical protein